MSEIRLTEKQFERITESNKRIKIKVEEINKKLRDEKVIMDELSKNLKEIQCMCPHTDYTHHGRQIAEDDPWNKCNICGASF